jgi:hypothetical protein
MQQHAWLHLFEINPLIRMWQWQHLGHMFATSFKYVKLVIIDHGIDSRQCGRCEVYFYVVFYEVKIRNKPITHLPLVYMFAQQFIIL